MHGAVQADRYRFMVLTNKRQTNESILQSKFAGPYQVQW